MKRQVPLVLCFLFGVVMILTEFSPHATSQSIYNEIVNWTLIVWPFATVLAVATLVQTPLGAYSTTQRTLAVQLCCICGDNSHGCHRGAFWHETPCF